jgi:hypothetical protein
MSRDVKYIGMKVHKGALGPAWRPFVVGYLPDREGLLLARKIEVGMAAGARKLLQKS